MEILHIENLSFSYPLSNSKALDCINLKVEEGDFVLICGKSGCGKTTLLKMIKKQLSPYGKKEGRVLYRGRDVQFLDDKTSACDIGYVHQDPESQIITDKVWHEMSFGLENAGYSENEISQRLVETACFFGIEKMFERNTYELSGGQKQLLNLACVTAMYPKIILLDEPTAQLDPINARNFIETIKRLNRDYGITVIIVEHDLEELLFVADKVVVINEGKVVCTGTGEEICKKTNDEEFVESLPTSAKILKRLNIDDGCLKNVKEARSYILDNFSRCIDACDNVENSFKCRNKAIELKNISFRYEKYSKDILNNLDLDIYENEVFSLMGGNASGKTTLLKILAGIQKPYRGQMKMLGVNINQRNKSEKKCIKTAYLSQRPKDVFAFEKIIDDFKSACQAMGYDNEKADEEINNISKKLSIRNLLFKHPNDLSYGQQQKCAIGKIMLLKADVFLFDEPTKGIDSYSKKYLVNLIKELKKEGATVIIATHDAEFAGECSDRCAFLFGKRIFSFDSALNFFSHNNFYTTQSSRIARGIFPNTITFDGLISVLKNGEGR